MDLDFRLSHRIRRGKPRSLAVTGLGLIQVSRYRVAAQLEQGLTM